MGAFVGSSENPRSRLVICQKQAQVGPPHLEEALWRIQGLLHQDAPLAFGSEETDGEEFRNFSGISISRTH